MADAIDVSCPNCHKPLRVPAAVAGKTVRCKGCNGTFKVPAAARPADAPLPAKKVKKAALAQPDDEDDDTPGAAANPYGLIKNAEEEVARCPHCADVLDPPDTKICLTCGYDMLERRRHESRKTYDLTAGDWVAHHALTFVAVLGVAALITVIVLCVTHMGAVFTEIGLENDQEDPVTKRKGYVVPPGACSTPIIVGCLFGIWKLGKFAFKRIVFDWRPPETIKLS
jgi:hypothetical protein